MRLDPERVRGARERLGYSLELAGEVGDLSPNSVLRAEHGLSIQPATARRIAKALQVEVADLVPLEKVPA
jgi:transcriptional regulator with XRE-family HTH domain